MIGSSRGNKKWRIRSCEVWVPGRILEIFKEGRAGLLPTRPKVVRNLDGEFCATPADSLRRWKQHFSTVLNTSSMFSEDMINSFPSYAVHDGMTCVPSLQEVRDALSLIAGVGLMVEAASFKRWLRFVMMSCWCIWCNYLVVSGRAKLFHRISGMHYWYLYLRRVTCPCVIIGEESVCWMWWVKFLLK